MHFRKKTLRKKNAHLWNDVRTAIKSHAALFCTFKIADRMLLVHFVIRMGCAAGRRIPYPPESWTDNANLDYASALVGDVNIKKKYGDSLSCGDLFVFAGTTAILQGGEPVGEICGDENINKNENEMDSGTIWISMVKFI